MKSRTIAVLAPLLALVAVSLIAPAPLSAQAVTGTLLGNVTDAAGLAIPGATVTITEVNTNISASSTTNESGYYVFSRVKDGVYRVEAELSGFKKAAQDDVVVQVNTTRRVDLRLEIGTVAETITVVGQSALLQTDRTDTGRLIESTLIQEVPLAYRNFQAALITVPGSTRPHRPHSVFFNSQDSLATEVNGQSRLANNVLIEGIDDNHKTGLLTVLIPSTEAIETVSVTTSNYDAEFGRAGGAVTSVTLKSGTNQFRGSAFVGGNTEATIATEYFSHTKAPTKALGYGFTLGGPIRRNKLFFFGDYQRIIDNVGKVQRSVIPPVEWRTGDFSRAATIIYNPFTGNPDGTGRQPFAGNVIPPTMISPIAQKLLTFIAAPTITGAAFGQINFEQPYTTAKTTDGFDTKVNQQMSDRNALAVRFSYQRPVVIERGVYGIYGGGGRDFAGTGTNFTISTGATFTRTWSNTLVQEIRGGVSYYHNKAVSEGQGLKTSDEVGIRGANINDFSTGLTSIQINQGFSNQVLGFSNSLPWDRSERTVEVSTVLTKVVGNHTVKVGGNIRHNRDFLLQVQDTGGPRGRFTFSAPQTSIPTDQAAQSGIANAFASFLLDVPSQVGRDLTVIDPGTRHWALFSYLHDKWQATPKITIDLGLRHEYYTPLVGLADKGGLSNYDPSTGTLRIAGYGDVSNSVGVKPYYRNFAPRTGLSYRITDTSVVRVGYGISTIPFPDNSYAFNYPVKQNNQFNPPNSFAPTSVHMADGFPAPVLADIPQNGAISVNTPLLRSQRFFAIPSDLHEGKLQSWNVAYQRELPGGFTAEAAYVGNRGDIVTSLNINAGRVLGADNAGRPEFAPFGRTADTTGWTRLNTRYHSLQAKLDRRFSNGLLITTSYTLGRGLNYGQGDSNGGVPTPSDLPRSLGRAEFDRTHSYVQSFVYMLPVGKQGRWLQSGPASWILGDWQVSGIFAAQSGTPINFTASGASLRLPGNTQRPNASGTPPVRGDIGPGNLWFDTAVFSAPPPNTFGNVPRNALLNGPAFVNLDATIAKWFTVRGNSRAEVRIDAFNITNTPHFSNPNGDFGNARFGQITSAIAGSERVVRFGLRVVF
ncbi:MAG: TonB-dependent receptor [Acidobacteria bacterium]|nr:TonB-dependent receptor [Acidobacteriota bacterium]